MESAQIKVVLSTAGTGLGNFAIAENGVYRKDFIRTGDWTVPGVEGKWPVTATRIKKWEDNFKLMRTRGVTVPLTVDHMEIRDPATGKLLLKKMTPAMAEAKRGVVVGLHANGNTGMLEVSPADAEAVALMNRCPEVSLEMERNFTDGAGNFYDEAITAITLTPKPVIPGQQQQWQRIAASLEGDRQVIYLSADPVIDSPAVLKSHSEILMLEKLRKLLGLADDAAEDVVLSKFTEQVSLSRTAADALKGANTKNEELTAQLLEANKKTPKIALGEIPVDEDALEMAADAINTRIEALVTNAKITPAQKPLLLSLCVGSVGVRNKIALSRKVATAAGLAGPLADAVLKIFEAATPAEMAELLKANTGVQKNKVVLSREGGDGVNADYDPELTKKMIANANGGPGSGSLVF